MTVPTPERMGQITCGVWELALAGLPVNGGGPLPADSAWLLQAVALSAPGTAARCPHVLAALPAHVRAAVRRLAEAAPVPPLARVAEQGAGSEPERRVVGSGEAARVLGITARGVRAAILRGHLPAAKAADGEWLIDRADLDDYRRRRE